MPTAIVASSAAIGGDFESGPTTLTLINRPSRLVMTNVASRVGRIGQPSTAANHQPSMVPMANTEPCAKLATFVTPKMSDMPTATRA